MLIIQGAISLGLIFSLMAIGVYLTFRVLKMPDLSVEGSIIFGAGVTARLISRPFSVTFDNALFLMLFSEPVTIAFDNPFAITFVAMVTGMLAGFTTGILHTKFKIPSILAGILTMVASYSLVIRMMDASNIALPPHGPWRVTTVFTFLQDFYAPGLYNAIPAPLHGMLNLSFLTEGFSRSMAVILVSIVVVIVACVVLYCFMGTEFGSAIRATGNNMQMVRAQGINTDWTIVVTLMLSNGLVALAGSLWAQQLGFASVDMGIGTIVVGLASVIIAEVLFRPRMFWTHLIAIVIGSILYRFIIALALSVDFMEPTDLRLITAIIVAFALVLPLLLEKFRIYRRRNIVVTLLFCLIPFMALYWLYLILTDLYTMTGVKRRVWLDILFFVLTGGIYGFFLMYPVGRMEYKILQERGVTPKDRSLMYLIFAIPGWWIVIYALVQSRINLAESSEGAQNA